MRRSCYLFLIIFLFVSQISFSQSTNAASTITCDEVFRFQSRCTPWGAIQNRVGLNNKFHTGEFVQITIDSVLYDIEIDTGGLGKVTVEGFAPGIHITELIYPAGCYPPITVICHGRLDKSGDEWIDEASGHPGATTVLLDNYPDPFNPSTTIRYSLGEESHVTLTVYNMLGQAVKKLVDQVESAGSREVIWDGSNDFGQKVASGMYLYRISAGNFTATKRMFLLK